MRRIAFLLARLARRLLPPLRAEWGEAMEAELHYLDDRAAARFAVGFLVTGLLERTDSMTPCTAERLNIAISIVFAGVLLAWKFLWPGGLAALPLVLAGWMIPFAYLSAKARRRRP
jgi:hypothetical protein